MTNGNSIVNLGDLTKPATVLIEKIAEATGAVFRPYQIRRMAKAEAEAEKIKAIANIEITEIQQRGLQRFINEQGRQQENIENITAQAIPELDAGAKPEAIEDDWIANFFDKCKLISDREMQSLWAKLLAGEANQPDTFSKRTVEFVSTLDKSDAQLFTNLCSFAWLSQEFVLLIYDLYHDIYKQQGITYAALTHLDTIGLITFNSITGFAVPELPKAISMSYHETTIDIEFQDDEKHKLDIGNVVLTKIGKELAPLCGAMKSDEFVDYIISKWQELGYITSCPLKDNVDAA